MGTPSAGRTTGDASFHELHVMQESLPEQTAWPKADRWKAGQMMNELFDDASAEETLCKTEREMRERAADLFDRLVMRLAEHVPRDVSTDERRHIVEGLIDADPGLHDMAERLAILNLFCGERLMPRP